MSRTQSAFLAAVPLRLAETHKSYKTDTQICRGYVEAVKRTFWEITSIPSALPLRVFVLLILCGHKFVYMVTLWGHISHCKAKVKFL